MKLKSGAIATISLILLGIAAGCRQVDNVVYSDFVCFDRNGWDPAHSEVFYPWPGDSALADIWKMDVKIVARHSLRCDIESLPLLVETEDENGSIASDTILIDLTKPKENAMGIAESSAIISKGYKPQPGYNVILTSLLNQEDTKGILSVGVVMSQHNTIPKELPFFNGKLPEW